MGFLEEQSESAYSVYHTFLQPPASWFWHRAPTSTWCQRRSFQSPQKTDSSAPSGWNYATPVQHVRTHLPLGYGNALGHVGSLLMQRGIVIEGAISQPLPHNRAPRGWDANARRQVTGSGHDPSVEAEPVFRPGREALGSRSHFGTGRLQSALPARAQLSATTSREQTRHQKNARLRPPNSPPESHKAVKHQLLLDCGQLEASKSYLLHKAGPDSFIATGGTTLAADPFEVSAQIRQIRRPNAGLCSVPGRRETADPFVHVANVKWDRTTNYFVTQQLCSGSQEAAKPARDKSHGTSEEKERRDRSRWLLPLSPLSNQLPLMSSLHMIMITVIIQSLLFLTVTLAFK